MTNNAEIGAKFMEKIGEELEVSWHDYGKGVEIQIETDGFKYSFNFKPDSEDAAEDHEKMGKAHTALAEAIKEVEEEQ